MNITKKDGLIVIVLSAALALLGLFFMDKSWIHDNIPERCGAYCQMAMNYWSMLLEQSFDRKFLQKSIGALLVSLVSPIADLKTPLQINYALQIVGATFLIFSAVYFYLIGKATKCNRLVFYTLFVCLFVNQIFIKIEPYTQESPDCAAFLLGMMSAYYFLKNKYGALLFTFCIASIIQPQARLLMIPLIIFCGINVQEPEQKKLTIQNKGYLFLFIAILFVFLVCGYLLPSIREPNHGVANAIKSLMPVSIFLGAAALLFALYKIRAVESFQSGLKLFMFNKDIRNRSKTVALIFAVSFGIILFLAQGEILSKGSTLKGVVYYSYSVVYHMLEAPLKSWIVHLGFFGPLPLIFLLRKPSAPNRTMDVGLTLSIALSLIFSLDSESRHLIGFMPWLACLFMKKKYSFNVPVSALIIILTIIASRFYGSYGSATPEYDKYLFMWGPWMTVADYQLTTAIVAGSCFLLFLVYKLSSTRKAPPFVTDHSGQEDSSFCK